MNKEEEGENVQKSIKITVGNNHDNENVSLKFNKLSITLNSFILLPLLPCHD